eukprot:TRINITY_DN724_c0_g1_i1.p1 TRINITY_DN724_c0_g1~~TRINITY_DN724_c0_g1_i1.p1  ORF type:complete len:289 (-),score=61.48 TRINITY_DN724_c0_g1_i1:135-1001(-)
MSSKFLIVFLLLVCFSIAEYVTEPLVKKTESKPVTLEEWNKAGDQIPVDEKPEHTYGFGDCFMYEENFLKNDHKRLILQYLHVSMSEVLDKFEIPYMIYAGTLLGAVRKQRYIPWTADADIMMPFQVGYLLDKSKAFEEALAERDIIYWRDPKKSTDGVGRACLHKDSKLFPKSSKPFPDTKNKIGFYVANYPYLDLYSAKERVKGKFMNHLHRSGKITKTSFQFETQSVFPTSKCAINGNEFTCARDTHHMLFVGFGRNWRKPKANQWNDAKYRYHADMATEKNKKK